MAPRMQSDIRFDVKARSAIRYPPLEEHLARVGITLYQRTDG